MLKQLRAGIAAGAAVLLLADISSGSPREGFGDSLGFGRWAGLPTHEMRPPNLYRGIHEAERKPRFGSGCCRCPHATSHTHPFHGKQYKAEPELICCRCSMRPESNAYSEEVMRALKSRGGAIWTRLHEGEQLGPGRRNERRMA
ncbi:unnamed protein product [Effrenium voratum]|nr:unnamed protein product [Effrenium voratum]